MSFDASTRRSRGGQVVLVTGASGGLGLAAARRLGSEGAQVLVVDLDPQRVAETASMLSDEGIDAHPAPCDQTDVGQVAALFESTVARYGRLDACFANAGWGTMSPFVDQSIEDWRRTMDVNLTGTFLVCQGAARRMIECGNGGSIVVTSSSGAVAPAAMVSAYCTSKAALNTLVSVMAYELGPHGIRVNALMPGVTRTALNARVLDGPAGALLPAEIPLGRLGEPADMAAMVSFLTSPDASYVTGTAMLVDGGATLRADLWFETDFTEQSRARWRPRFRREEDPPTPRPRRATRG